MPTISVIGTGLIGTSLALALKQSALKDLFIVGTDLDHTSRSGAKRSGAFDKIEGRLFPAIENADIVVIATPIMAMEAILEVLSPELPNNCVVTDVGSSKGIVLEWAEKYLPSDPARNVSFIAGHPMAGKETSGPNSADATLFQGKTYCVIPTSTASERAVSEITTMVEAVGAKPLFIGAEEHDSFVAAASHLPFLLSVALVGCTSKSPNWQEISQLAASGYRDITRLASGDPTMHRDICLTNAKPIVAWLDAVMKELGEYRDILSSSENPDAQVTRELFEQASNARAQWLAGSVQQENRLIRPQTDLPTFGEGMSQMFFGRLGTRMRNLITGSSDEGRNKRR